MERLLIVKRRSNFYLSLIFLILLLCINFIVWQMHFLEQKKLNDESFRAYANHIDHSISRQIDTYIQLLEQGSNFYKSSDVVTRQEFTEYFHDILETRQFKGAERVVFINRTSNRNTYEELIKKEPTTPENKHYYFSIFPPGIRTEYFPINYIVPEEDSGSYFGFDVATAEEFKEDFLQAALKNQVIVTKNKTFINKEYILLIRPLYAKDKPNRTELERQRSLVGYLVLFLNPITMFDTVFDDKEMKFLINTKLYSGYGVNNINSNNLPLFENNSIPLSAGKQGSDYFYSSRMLFADKQVTLTVEGERKPESMFFEKTIPTAIFIFHSVVILAFFLLMIDMSYPELPHNDTKE